MPPAFAGFPPGPNPYTPLPDAFFTSALPEIEDINEVKVTLHLFWLLYQKVGDPRCASDRELLADPLLRRALRRRGDPRPYEERLRAALESARARGLLLRVRVRIDDEIVTWYFFNTERSRAAVADLLQGAASPETLLEVEGPIANADLSEGLESAAHRLSVEIERPNIFTLYEQNIGLLAPLVAEELRDAGERYPWDWIEAAFREATQQNKRKWSYIRAILKRWETDGKGGEPYGAHGRYSR
ncbi:MAG TPA: DnaD domain protein [Ktedonobacterales bacterium]|jgi:DnaD/phage-associated family protein|nr:DnaD domain protein [Ktedonobacterales bacterium]